MVRLALCSALSDRAADGKVVVLDEWAFETPKTKDAVAVLESLDLTGKVLIVLGEEDEVVWRSFRNLGDAHCLFARELNAYDVLVADYVVFTRDTLPGVEPAGPPSETQVKVEAKVEAAEAEDDSSDDDETEDDDADA
jgi:large subunit ribosomal protein L4